MNSKSPYLAERRTVVSCIRVNPTSLMRSEASLRESEGRGSEMQGLFASTLSPKAKTQSHLFACGESVGVVAPGWKADRLD